MLAKHHELNRAKCWMLLGCLTASCLGCSVCPSPYDYDYGTYGTKTPRTDMRHGRVGSILSDPVYRGGGTLVEPSVMTEGIISEGMISEGVISDGIISEGIISEGVISGEPQRVLRSPMRAPLRSPLGSQGEIIIE
jgi:hypothetical protein